MDKNLELKDRVDSLEKENRLLDAKVLEIYSLYNISKRLSVTTQLEEIFNGTMDIIGTSLNIDDFCILLLDVNRKKLIVGGLHSDTDLKDVEFKLGEGICGRVAESGEMSLVPDVSKVSDFLFYKGKKTNIGSFLSIPLKGRSGEVLGVLNVNKAEIDSFSAQDVDLFTEVAEQIAVAVDKALSLKNLKDISIRDPLTGLYNRRYFFEHFERDIDRSKRYGGAVSIIICDIDFFKNFNDSNGHLKGDDALKAVAKIFEKSLRKSDVAARFGGEEFIAILPETPKEWAMEVAEKLRASIDAESVEGQENQPGGNLTATFGVACYPDDADFGAELIDCADKALYLGKAKGRNIVVPYVKDLITE
ncbi:MAG: sensor domain-containing diguanylate cyclase [Proteobacteria bacterium]|nr:sensor domain-containing diguanylate cyclase [Pseudomonadota bacterium]